MGRPLTSHFWGSSVVGKGPLEKQTKESARRDGAAAAWLLCGPYVSIVWLWIICFYWLAVGVGLGHMFLLCDCGPYVSIVWRSAICFYCVCVCVCVCACVCVCDHMFS